MMNGMRVAYFDCFNGAAGDMIVGALLDAGADLEAVRSGLARLNVSGYETTVERVRRHGFSATQFSVRCAESAKQPHRHLSDLLGLLEAARFPGRVGVQAAEVFRRLAAAEARVHGTTIEQVHFHEVGAVDALVDVVGGLLALEWFKVDRVLVSAIPVGSGTVTCEHGVLPVPAPATSELLRGVSIATTEESGELTTPTGAAMLTALAAGYGPLPSMTIDRVGYGAGRREGETRPNVLRVFIGTCDSANDGADVDVDEVMVVETNLDDTSPQIIAHCLERLMGVGALDAYTVPLQMKKSRPGVMLVALCRFQDLAVVEEILFSETPTLGVRRHAVRRRTLRREIQEVATRFGAIRMKIGRYGTQFTATPEFEDCRQAAERHHAALREVIQAAQTAWESQGGTRT